MNKIIEAIKSHMTQEFARELRKGDDDELLDRVFSVLEDFIGQKFQVEVFTATIEHQRGFNHYVAPTQDELFRKLGEYVSDYKEQAGNPDAYEVAKNDYERVEAYFEDHEYEWFTWDFHRMEVTL